MLTMEIVIWKLRLVITNGVCNRTLNFRGKKWKYCIWNASVNINRYVTVKKVVRDYFANIKYITKHNRVKLYNKSFIF